MKPVPIQGVDVYPGYLDPTRQNQIVADIRDVVRQAPLFRPVTSRGKEMSVRLTSAGTLGWVSDRGGYRYDAHHPSGMSWPAIPASVLAVWHELAAVNVNPDCCLVNFYGPDARMGLHQDRDEVDFEMPVVSISLGDDALFRVGGQQRSDPTRSIWLRSGDVAVLAGPARLAFHGIDRLRAGSSTLLLDGGRLNLTLRVAR